MATYKTKTKEDLANELFGIFNAMFRSIGTSMSIMQLEKLRKVADGLSGLIQNAAGLESVRICKALQEGIEKGFDKLEEDIKQLQDAVFVKLPESLPAPKKEDE